MRNAPNQDKPVSQSWNEDGRPNPRCRNLRATIAGGSDCGASSESRNGGTKSTCNAKVSSAHPSFDCRLRSSACHVLFQIDVHFRLASQLAAVDNSKIFV